MVASASYGSISALAEEFSTQDVGFAEYAFASFTDTLTVLGGSGDGYISYDFDGAFSTISDFTQGGLSFQQNSFPGENFTVIEQGRLNGSYQYETALYPFVFGVPFTVQVSVGANTVGIDDGGGIGMFTASLDGITVLDQNHDPFTGYTITSQSGATYPLPEPSSIALLGTLTALLGGLSYKKSRR